MNTVNQEIDQQRKDYLLTSHIIAVVGLSDKKEAVSYQVSRYMQEKGYRIVPVNPRLVGKTVLGESVYASLAAIPFPVDIVNVFRRNEYLEELAKEFIQIKARIFWAQLNLHSAAAIRVLEGAGHKNWVMDSCIQQEYARLIERGAFND